MVYYFSNHFAGVLELADETDSNSVVHQGVWVRVPPPAPKQARSVNEMQNKKSKLIINRLWAFFNAIFKISTICVILLLRSSYDKNTNVN